MEACCSENLASNYNQQERGLLSCGFLFLTCTNQVQAAGEQPFINQQPFINCREGSHVIVAASATALPSVHDPWNIRQCFADAFRSSVPIARSKFLSKFFSIVSAVCLLHAASVFALSQFCGPSAVEFAVCIGSKMIGYQSVRSEVHS